MRFFHRVAAPAGIFTANQDYGVAFCLAHGMRGMPCALFGGHLPVCADLSRWFPHHVAQQFLPKQTPTQRTLARVLVGSF